jgi:multiphosphoryl transfer protein
MTSTLDPTAQSLHGIAASPGRVAGPIWRWPEETPSQDPVQPSSPAGPDQLRHAIAQAQNQLTATAERLRRTGVEKEAGIMDAQRLILDDPAFVDAAMSALAGGAPAEKAVQSALEPYAAMLLASPDPVFRARAADLRDVTRQVQNALRGRPAAAPNPERPSIVVARDLAPSQTAWLDQDRVLGFATEMGSATAHTAILAQALGIPAVVGIPGLLKGVREGQTALLDGEKGTLLLDPPSEAIEAAITRVTPRSDPEPALTIDGRRIEIACNAAGLDDARRAAAAGADGIGLLRSEFLFMGRDTLPDEEEQVAILQDIVSAMGGRPVILRTLDVGADKPLPALPQPAEANPALGVRGLRLQLLRRKDLLAQQLRAALRVAAERPLCVMFPMVATVAELRAAKAVLGDAIEAIGADSPKAPKLQVGVMIEVPSAALMADTLAAEVDFFSLGTNDLTQYVFAADRTNPELAHLADSLHPASLRLIRMVVEAAHRHGKWVGVCGEMASDPWALALLIGLGIDELSLHPPLVAGFKARVRTLDSRECERVARDAIGLEDGQQVRDLLSARGLRP